METSAYIKPGTSRYTERCIEWFRTFRDLGLPGVTTFETEEVDADGTRRMFEGSAYINRREWVTVMDWGEPREPFYAVFINNPFCDTDEKGCPIFTEEHPNVQWVFGYYKSFKRAMNRAIAITKARKYPKPIEIY